MVDPSDVSDPPPPSGVPAPPRPPSPAVPIVGSPAMAIAGFERLDPWDPLDEWDVDPDDHDDPWEAPPIGEALAAPPGEATSPRRPPAIAFAMEPEQDDAPVVQPLPERVRALTSQVVDFTLERPPQAMAGRQPIPLPSRYTWLATLGEGGQGRVDLVFDKDLGRSVALKTLHAHRNLPSHVLEFYREARVTGQLEHPHIIPIHDAGQLPDGRLYYTMRRMPGESLHNVLYRVRRGDAEVLRRWSMLALVQVLERAAHGVGFAHARGVIHRDIKPANILLGNHGEVLVVDWGIARVTGADEDGTPGRLWSRKGDARTERVRGSPPYMAPEQVKHPDQVTPAADVFCLGVILYEILCRVPPFAGVTVEDIVESLCHERPAPPRERAPELAIPAELEEICLRCLEKFPGHRYANASELAQAISEYLGGGRRREAAARRLREAEGMQARYRTLVTRARTAADEARGEPLGAAGRDEDSRARARRGHLRAESLARARDGVFSEAIWALHRALADEPESREARSRLAELYAARYAEAERLGLVRELAFYRAMLRHVDDGRWGRWLRTGAELQVAVTPQGLPIALYRLREDEHRLVLGEPIPLGPEGLWSLPPGRYALALPPPSPRRAGTDPMGRVPSEVPSKVDAATAPRPTPLVTMDDAPPGSDLDLSAGSLASEDDGDPPVPDPPSVSPAPDPPPWIYPIRLDRGERRTLRLDFRGAEQAGERFCFIPGGSALLGGDPLAAGSPTPSVREIAAFSIARHPVTNGAWARYLQWVDEVDPDEARRRTPPGFRDARAQGDLRPVTGVTWEDAAAYCRFLCEATGQVLRLPSVQEWEKAARGADGRAYPWGDGWDDRACASLALGEPQGPPPEVGSFPTDRSPFGMEDSAGGVWEWTGTALLGDRHVVVGGSILSEPDGCRSAVRRALGSTTRLHFLGFRVVLEVGSAGST